MSEQELFYIFGKNDAKQHINVSIEHSYSEVAELLGQQELFKDQLKELRSVFCKYKRLKKKRLTMKNLLNSASTVKRIKKRQDPVWTETAETDLSLENNAESALSQSSSEAATCAESSPSANKRTSFKRLSSSKQKDARTDAIMKELKSWCEAENAGCLVEDDHISVSELLEYLLARANRHKSTVSESTSVAPLSVTDA